MAAEGSSERSERHQSEAWGLHEHAAMNEVNGTKAKRGGWPKDSKERSERHQSEAWGLHEHAAMNEVNGTKAKRGGCRRQQ
jgi:hypothetical protein